MAFEKSRADSCSALFFPRGDPAHDQREQVAVVSGANFGIEQQEHVETGLTLLKARLEPGEYCVDPFPERNAGLV